MNKLILSFFVVLGVFKGTQGMLPPFLQHRDACKQEVGLSDDELPDRHPMGTAPGGGAAPPADRPEPPRKFKCFLACVSEKAGIMSAAGELQADKLRATFGAAAADSDFAKCSQLDAGDDKCEKAWLVERCVMDAMRNKKNN